MKLTRRQLFTALRTSTMSASANTGSPKNNRFGSQKASINLPIVVHIDRRGSQIRTTHVRWFWECLLREAEHDLIHAGVRITSTVGQGWIERGDIDAFFHGVQPEAINVYVTHWIPLCWDLGRGLCGLSGLAGATEVIVVSAENAHRHIVPYLATNTLAHEIGHVLRGDLRLRNPGGWEEQQRELSLDRIISHVHYGIVEPAWRRWKERRTKL
jgi:hypothetical protein